MNFNLKPSILSSIFIAVAVLMSIPSSFAQERNYSIDTVAGKLTVSSKFGELNCIIKLGAKVIANYECDYSPHVLNHFKKDVAPFDEIIVFQNVMTGNACDGLDIFFIGINKDKKYEISESIPYCGGPAPIIVIEKGKVTVTLPRHRANRGNNYINKEVWIFEDGALRQLK
jgi:hypothetical protein